VKGRDREGLEGEGESEGQVNESASARVQDEKLGHVREGSATECGKEDTKARSKGIHLVDEGRARRDLAVAKGRISFRRRKLHDRHEA